MVLTYRDNQLDAIHSSTPSVQFVRLDVTTSELAHDRVSAAPSISGSGKQLTVLSLTELPADLRHTAQRVFRRSSKR